MSAMKTSIISAVPAPSEEAPADFRGALARFDAHASGEDWLSLMAALNRGEDAESAFLRGVQSWARRHGEKDDDCGH